MTATAATSAMSAELTQFKTAYENVRREIGTVIVGQDRVVEGVLCALFAGGHVLLEGVPGLGKTELVKAISKSLELHFRRIQFTPDLMPADIIGTTIMTQTPTGGYHLEFRKGPIFTQLLLADEINRATPKTQAALLETMQEGSVTVAGKTEMLAPPFIVLATQNPLEQEGTYPLPEAQLDRFLFKIEVPFPTAVELNEIVSRTILKKHVEPAKVLDSEAVLNMRKLLDHVVVADAIREYAVKIVVATHPGSDSAPSAVKKYVRYGASPRAAQALIKAGRVRALARGNAHLSTNDIKAFALEVLQHRVLLNYDGLADGITVKKLLADILTELPEA